MIEPELVTLAVEDVERLLRCVGALEQACAEWEAWMEKGLDVEEPQPDDRKALAEARAVLGSTFEPNPRT